CSKSNLVAVGAVSMSSLSDKLLLRKLSFHRIFHRNGRICRSCHTHCLVNISTAGQRVTDGSAKAGCSASKRLDLGRMIVCLVLKVDKPLFFLSVHFDRHYDTARIDLIGLLLILKLSFFFQLPHCHQGKVHQADKLVLSAFENFTVCL